MKKRLLSLLLAVSMLISLMPALSVGAEEEVSDGFKFVYSFNLDGSTGTPLKTIGRADAHNMWTLSEQSTPSMYNDTKTHGAFGVQTGQSPYVDSAWLVFNLNVPFAGSYAVSLIRGMSNTGGGYGNVWLFRPGTEITAELLAETAPLNAEEIPYYVFGTATKQCSPMTLSESFEIDEAGDWVLVFKPTRKGPGQDGIEAGDPEDTDDVEGSSMYIHSVTLTAADNLAAVQVVPKDEALELNIGAYKTIYITTYLSDNTVAEDGDCIITFESSDESVAKVSELGLVNGVGAGNAKIKVRAQKGASIAEAEVDITVLGDASDANVLSSVEVEVNEGYASIKSAKMTNGGDADLKDAKITYGVENLDVAGIDEATGEIIPGGTAGTAIVYATVILDGVSVTGKTEAEVTPSTAPASGVEASYDFYQVDKTGWAKANVIEENAAHNDNSFVKSGRDIWFITDEYTTDAWEWAYTNRTTVDGGWVASVALLDLQPDSLRVVLNDKWIALRLDVPEDGLYWPSITTLKSKASANGKIDVYLFSENELSDANGDSKIGNADVTAYIKNKATHGTVDFKSSDEAFTSVTEPLTKLALKKGKNILVLKQVKGTGVTNYISSLTLDGTNALRTVNLNLERETIDFGKGESESSSEVSARLRDGTLVQKADLTLTYGSDNEEIATFENGTVKAKSCGTTEVFVKAEYNGTAVTSRKTITVTDTGGVKKLHVSAGDGVAYEGEKLLLSAYAEMNSGKVMPLDNGEIEFEITEGAGRLLAGGYVTNAGDISEEITVKVVAHTSVLGESCKSGEVELIFKPSTFKKEPTYYTYERRAAVAENIRQHEWARDELELYKSYCEDYLSGFDMLYKTIVGEGIPRSNQVGEFTDITDYAYCRYCGKNISGKYTASANARQWKIQCPECKRLFPSNDFEKFLALGIEEGGTFNREKALVANGKLCGTIAEDGTILNEDNPYGYGIPGGYLYNELYSELRDPSKPESYNKDPRTGEEIDGNVWGVDDGMGYRPDGMYENSNVSSRHTYVGYWLHTALIEVHRAIKWLSTVYAYTGDEEYGVKGAILLDRLVDVYPTYHFKQWFNDDYKFFVSHGGNGFGKIFGCINDCEYTLTCLRAADALYPLLTEENEALISALSGKATEYGYINRNEDGSVNEKKSGSEIWHSWENKLLREAFTAAKDADLDGNYGQLQKLVSTAALVLDSEPESKQMIEWVYQYGTVKYNGDEAVQTGGNLNSKLVDDVDRDGMGNEGAAGYNIGWITDLYDTAEALVLYGNPDYNLYNNAKFAKMFSAGIPVALVDTHTAQTGDTKATADVGFSTDMQVMVNGFKELRDTTLGNQLAEYIYRTNGYSVEGLHYDIYTADSESVQQDILERIDDDPSAPSEMMAGYGFAVLRDGGAYGDVGTPTYTNNKRDFWIYFGRNEGHGHYDILNLGIEAFGLNFAPDNGTPEKKSNNRPRYQWTEATLSHNTVNVNAYRQSNSGFHGYPQHFDDSGDVKLMDIDAPQVYADTSIYRRTLVMIDAGPDTSYGVDFFRVKGGNEHIYSFHAQSDTADLYGVDANKVIAQVDEETGEYVGSYEGRDVDWGVRMDYSEKTTQFENIGKSMLGEVRRAGEDALSGDTFAVDFKITDFNKVLKNGSSGLRLRLTMLNDDTDAVTTEVALAKGKNTGNASNTKLPDLEYALIKREGENLDSLYTSVYEPYRNARVLSDMTEVEIAPSAASSAGEGADDISRAIKVTRADGRVDYVTYATNNNVLYTVTDGEVSFDFRGFVGVYSLNCDGGEVIYRYVNDGDIIGNKNDGSADEETPSGNTAEPFEYKGYNGTVSDYTKGDPSLTNFITIHTDDVIDTESLAGKYVYVSNDGVQNAAYPIVGAEAVDGGYKLNIGSVTTVRSFADASDTSLGYIYNIQNGQNAYIPISNVEDYNPKFTASDATVSAGSTLTIALSATPDGNAESITYLGTTLPRGASIDETTGRFTWKPTSSQVGNHNVAVTARDEYGRETTVNFTVTVYGSTTSKPTDNNTNDSAGDSADSAGSSGTSGGGGGGGSSGQGTMDTTPNGSASENTDTSDETENGDASNQPDVGFGENIEPKFTDLDNHSWASDAINSLASDGIIRGTTETTYSPAANITRADFALLLVRAFELSSDNTENFADVSASDYFAPELAIARNTGIISGIGDNKYAPRNTITRQDMMVIVYRAIKPSLPKGSEAKRNVDAAMNDSPVDYQNRGVTEPGEKGTVEDGGGIQAPAEYPDFDTVAPYARDAVSYLISAGLVNGKSGLIAPLEYTTRAEIAVLLERVLDYIK